MKTNIIQTKCLEAEDGKILRSKFNKKLVFKKIFLSQFDIEENYEEVDMEIAMSELQNELEGEE
jgi:hypothetical protein